MLDEKDLQAIAKLISASEARMTTLIKEEVGASEARMTTLIKEEVGASEARMTKKIDASEARMTEKISASEARMTEKISASEARMMALMEAYFEPRFNLLGDQFQLLHEKIPQVEALESLDIRVSALEVAVKQHTEEIKQLKKAQ